MGDYFLVQGENLVFPEKISFSMYALAALLPLLPAKQRVLQPNDWMLSDSIIACPDPNGRELFEDLDFNIEILPIGKPVDEKTRALARMFMSEKIWEVPQDSIPQMPNYPGRGSAVAEANHLGIPSCFFEIDDLVHEGQELGYTIDWNGDVIHRDICPCDGLMTNMVVHGGVEPGDMLFVIANAVKDEE